MVNVVFIAYSACRSFSNFKNWIKSSTSDVEGLLVTPIRTVIIDDEPLARQTLRNLLKQHDDLQLVAECSDGDQATNAILDYKPDLIFLDVQLPVKNGFDVLEEIPFETMPVVVFVTAYEQYAVKAFEVHAIDYLLKPIDKERFNYALERVRKEIERARGGGDLKSRVFALLKDKDKQPKYLERIKVKSSGSYIFLRVEETDWIESEANYLRLHVGKNSYLVRGTMNNIEQKLDPAKFVRIRRSAIVNLDSVKEINPWVQHGEYALSLTDGRKLTISRNYRERLLKLIGESE
jgi:two-component system LytT family response regulator